MNISCSTKDSIYTKRLTWKRSPDSLPKQNYWKVRVCLGKWGLLFNKICLVLSRYSHHRLLFRWNYLIRVWRGYFFRSGSLAIFQRAKGTARGKPLFLLRCRSHYIHSLYQIFRFSLESCIFLTTFTLNLRFWLEFCSWQDDSFILFSFIHSIIQGSGVWYNFILAGFECLLDISHTDHPRSPIIGQVS